MAHPIDREYPHQGRKAYPTRIESQLQGELAALNRNMPQEMPAFPSVLSELARLERHLSELAVTLNELEACVCGSSGRDSVTGAGGEGGGLVSRLTDACLYVESLTSTTADLVRYVSGSK